jgi:hypothetical protein
VSSNSIEPVETRKKATVRQRPAVDDDMPIREATRAEEKRARPAEKDAQTDAVAQRHNLYTTDRRFPTAARVYYSDYQQKQEVMRAKTNTITTRLNDRQTVGAMLDLAQERGWQSVKLRGTEDFRREAWVQAEVRGMKTEGYKATNTDLQELARRVNVVAAKSGETASAFQEPKPVKVAKTSDEATADYARQAAAAKQAPVAAQNSPEKLYDRSKQEVEMRSVPPASKASAPEKAKALDEDAWRREQEKAAPAAQTAAASPVHLVTEKDVWNTVEAHGKQARQQDQPVQKPAEKARASAAEAA